MILGNPRAGAPLAELAASQKWVSRFTVPTASRLAKLSLLLDGLGSGSGSQKARPVVYAPSGALVGFGDESAVADNQAAGWVDFSFLGSWPGGLPLSVGDYDFGLLADAASQTIRLYGAANLIPNGGFETNVAGWGAGANTVVRSTAQAKYGIASALFTSTVAADGQTIFTTPGFLPVMPLTTYTYSFWAMRAAGAHGIRTQMNMHDAGGGLTSAVFGPVISAPPLGVWALYSLTFTTASTTTQVIPYVRMDGGVAAVGDAYYVDGVQLEPGAVANDYLEVAPAKYNSDSYADGPTATFGTATSLTARLSLTGTLFLTAAAPDGADDWQLARLAFPDAQKALGSRPAIRATGTLTRAGWHGTTVHPERGSFAVAKSGSPYAELVGQRIRVTTRGTAHPRSVYAVVATEADLVEELSLSRRLFLALEIPALTDTAVVVEEVSEE